jgi:hypothetical protein
MAHSDCLKIRLVLSLFFDEILPDVARCWVPLLVALVVSWAKLLLFDYKACLDDVAGFVVLV